MRHIWTWSPWSDIKRTLTWVKGQVHIDKKEISAPSPKYNWDCHTGHYQQGGQPRPTRSELRYTMYDTISSDIGKDRKNQKGGPRLRNPGAGPGPCWTVPPECIKDWAALLQFHDSLIWLALSIADWINLILQHTLPASRTLFNKYFAAHLLQTLRSCKKFTDLLN